MQEYRVELDSYSGPLDLLLHLVRRHEIDLHDIPIATLTQQYLDHLKLIQEIDVELAGEFLVMASTLVEIKSAMLLPRPEMDEGPGATATQSTDSDPRYELVQQLIAYKRFKDAAAQLDLRRKTWGMRYPFEPLSHLWAQGQALAGQANPVEVDLEDANVADLCEAYAQVLESVGQHRSVLHEVLYDDTPIALHAEDILDRLEREGPMTLQDMFVGRENRGERLGLFLAMLELVRQSKVQLTQDQTNQQICLQLPGNRNDPQAQQDVPTDWTDPATGQVQYDWPSQEARQRAEQRALARARRQASDDP